MNTNEPSDELTSAEYRAIIRSQQSHIDSQQSHIERLRGMLWTAAGIDQDEPPLTEADFQEALALPAEMQIVNIVAELNARRGSGAGGVPCSK